jgi:hypothetical protein
MHANITDLFGKSPPVDVYRTPPTHATPAGVSLWFSSARSKFDNRLLTRDFDKIAFAFSHCWHRFHRIPMFQRGPAISISK